MGRVDFHAVVAGLLCPDSGVDKGLDDALDMPCVISRGNSGWPWTEAARDGLETTLALMTSCPVMARWAALPAWLICARMGTP